MTYLFAVEQKFCDSLVWTSAAAGVVIIDHVIIGWSRDERLIAIHEVQTALQRFNDRQLLLSSSM